MAADAPPAVKAAADIKAQEDQAAQKIKAIRYLATIGCAGCYPDVEEALIAAMEDCTEAVRYEAVLAVRQTAGEGCCCVCTHGACCSEKIQKKLKELAFDKKGCCKGEPSARVRRQARLALAACGPPIVFDEPKKPEEPGPTEGPSEGSSEGSRDESPDNEEEPGEKAPEAADPVTSILSNHAVRIAESLSRPKGVSQGKPHNGYSLEPLPPVLSPQPLPPVL